MNRPVLCVSRRHGGCERQQVAPAHGGADWGIKGQGYHFCDVGEVVLKGGGWTGSCGFEWLCDQSRKQEAGVGVRRGGSRVPEIGVSAAAVASPQRPSFPACMPTSASTLSPCIIPVWPFTCQNNTTLCIPCRLLLFHVDSSSPHHRASCGAIEQTCTCFLTAHLLSPRSN